MREERGGGGEGGGGGVREKNKEKPELTGIMICCREKVCPGARAIGGVRGGGEEGGRA